MFKCICFVLAGTHDLTLSSNTLSALQNGNYPLSVPKYSKSLRNGRGDRLPVDQWTHIQGYGINISFSFS